MIIRTTLTYICCLFLTGFINFAAAQTTTFDFINSNVGALRAISWNTSAWGSGFGHRLISIDPGSSTTLNLQARHNSATWKDVLVINSLGNVGVGLNNPAYPFHLRAVANARTRFEYGTTTIDVVDFGTGTLAYSESSGVFVNGKDALLMSGPGRGIRLITNSGSSYIERLRILPDGNVGIGKNNPTSKLEVNGTVKAKEVNVTASGWPDYVFRPEYKLMPLNEVEAFIQENGHLPNIPSEAEVMENGVDLGAVNALLLKKIEELTLYSISQNQKIDMLIERLERLENNK